METNNTPTILVNDAPVSLQEFEQLKKDPKKNLVEIEPGKFKLLERMYG